MCYPSKIFDEMLQDSSDKTLRGGKHLSQSNKISLALHCEHQPQIYCNFSFLNVSPNLRRLGQKGEKNCIGKKRKNIRHLFMHLIARCDGKSCGIAISNILDILQDQAIVFHFHQSTNLLMLVHCKGEGQCWAVLIFSMRTFKVFCFVLKMKTIGFHIR